VEKRVDEDSRIRHKKGWTSVDCKYEGRTITRKWENGERGDSDEKTSFHPCWAAWRRSFSCSKKESIMSFETETPPSACGRRKSRRRSLSRPEGIKVSNRRKVDNCTPEDDTCYARSLRLRRLAMGEVGERGGGKERRKREQRKSNAPQPGEGANRIESLSTRHVVHEVVHAELEGGLVCSGKERGFDKLVNRWRKKGEKDERAFGSSGGS
jgi:hypothetical protein